MPDGGTVLMIVAVFGASLLQAATGIFPEATFLTAIRHALREKAALIPINEQAFGRGVEAARAL